MEYYCSRCDSLLDVGNYYTVNWDFWNYRGSDKEDEHLAHYDPIWKFCPDCFEEINAYMEKPDYLYEHYVGFNRYGMVIQNFIERYPFRSSGILNRIIAELKNENCEIDAEYILKKLGIYAKFSNQYGFSLEPSSYIWNDCLSWRVKEVQGSYRLMVGMPVHK